MKKSTDDIPEFKTGKTRKWPAKVEPLPGATRRAPLALQPEHAQPSPEGGNAQPDTDPEARRIAAELSKLHKAGAVKNEQDAKFYANVVKTFGGTYIRSIANGYAPPGGERYNRAASELHWERVHAMFRRHLLGAGANERAASR